MESDNDDDRGPLITSSIDLRTESIDGLTSSIVLRLYRNGVVSIAPRLYLGGVVTRPYLDGISSIIPRYYLHGVIPIVT